MSEWVLHQVDELLAPEAEPKSPVTVLVALVPSIGCRCG